MSLVAANVAVRPDEAFDYRSLEEFLDLLCCPRSGEELVLDKGRLLTRDGCHAYAISDNGIPLFAEEFCSADGRTQQAHYDTIAQAYMANLSYPHTQEYMAYLDRQLLGVIDYTHLGTVGEICCGRGEAFHLLGSEPVRGVGVDVSISMLSAARADHPSPALAFVQGDATMLPLRAGSLDSVLMLGGIHHVGDRLKLFTEIARVLRPGGHFYFREPVSDLWLWRALRAVVYRVSPTLDHQTERPLRYGETAPVLEEAGLVLRHWKTHGLLGFCLFMNSDVLVFNRLFRFIPGIRALTRAAAAVDQAILSWPGLKRAGLQVIGVAQKPEQPR